MRAEPMSLVRDRVRTPSAELTGSAPGGQAA